MARTIMIGYDLNKPGQSYGDLIEAVKGCGLWWHCLDSTWIVKTDMSVVDVRDLLGKHMDPNDELLVVELNGVAAWRGFTEECSSWLKNNL